MDSSGLELDSSWTRVGLDVTRAKFEVTRVDSSYLELARVRVSIIIIIINSIIIIIIIIIVIDSSWTRVGLELYSS